MFDYMYNCHSSLLLSVTRHHHYEPLEDHCIVKRYLIKKKNIKKNTLNLFLSDKKRMRNTCTSRTSSEHCIFQNRYLMKYAASMTRNTTQWHAFSS